MSHTYNNKNTPGGRRRTGGSIAEVKKGNVVRYNPPKQTDFLEERRQTISQLRVAERLVEEQQTTVPINTPEEYKELVEGFKEQE